jgi:hypothetical protein
MRRLVLARLHPAVFTTAVFFAALFAALQLSIFTPYVDAKSQADLSSPTIIIPPDTKIQLAVTRPIWTRPAAVGDTVYAITAFPVTANGEMAIPPGTYAQGVIDGMTRPTWRSAHAEFQIHFTKFVFANGYVAELLDGSALANAYVQVSATSDILLDNGSPLEIVLQNPLALDARKIAEAVRVSKPPQLTQFKSATRCFPTSGSSGTSDTVIPGTSPTIIPGAPGFPDTVIPGTSPTIIPGTPGTPGTTCAAPPIVSSTSFSQDVRHDSFQAASALSVGAQKLAAGKYDLEWVGPGPVGSVSISQNGTLIARVQARIVTLDRKSPKAEVVLQTNPDGTQSLTSLQFKGSTSVLFFN